MLTLLSLFSLNEFNSRNSTLSKMAGVADGSRRETFMKVMIRDFMSRFLHSLDDRSIEGETPQAKRQLYHAFSTILQWTYIHRDILNFQYIATLIGHVMFQQYSPSDLVA